MVTALLLMTCLGADAGTPPPPPVRQWEVPQAIEAVDVPERVEGLGVPVAIHAVRSREKPEGLARFFQAQFAKAGLFLPPPGEVAQRSAHLQVTGLDPDTFIAYTVFLQANPDGTTTVILTEASLAERRSPAAAEVDFVPVMPGAVGVVTSRTEGLELARYRVKASADEVHAFHVQVLRDAGFREVRPGVFERAGEEIAVATAPSADGEVRVTATRRRSVAVLPEGAEEAAP